VDAQEPEGREDLFELGQPADVEESVAGAQPDPAVVALRFHVVDVGGIDDTPEVGRLVDEEQRFGVEHKQRLLGLRMSVEVITLSASSFLSTTSSMGTRMSG